MNIYQQIIILLSTIFLVCCSTKTAQTESEKNVPQNSAISLKPLDTISTNSPMPENKLEEAKDAQNNVLSYFYEIYPKGSGKPVDGLNFLEKDISNGYLRVTGNMEGYIVFTLFKGDKFDWIIEQITGCGPECDQRFQVYKFENGKLSSKKTFDSLFPKKKVDEHVAKLVKKLPKGHTNQELQSWIKLPQSGKSIDVLIVEQNPGHTSGIVSVYQAGKLDWNGSGFNFLPLNPKKPSPIDISSVR